MSLGASAAAELRALSEIAMANADARPSGYEEVPYLRFALRPKVDIGATARAQAGLGSLASVGVKGSLTFYETGLSAEADYFPSANALLSRVVKEETGIHGKVDAFVRLLGKRVNKTVAKFGDDVPRRQVLWENTRAANSRQPIAGKVPARPCNGEFGAGCNGSSSAPRPRPRPAPIPVRRCPACQLQ